MCRATRIDAVRAHPISCIKVYADDAPLPDNRSLRGE